MSSIESQWKEEMPSTGGQLEEKCPMSVVSWRRKCRSWWSMKEMPSIGGQ